ncbi:heme o synthase [Halovivax sp.]|uniref:heme o synthase n=1 Tax=Halovivax sp. TaxID=1935978 RepID=UPI0025B9BED5|nr:heme o synthase [Halovivax sp.]
MIPHIDRTRFAVLLVAATVATYLLIALGTAVSTTGSAGSCTTWPSCESGWALGPVTGDALLFWSHRAAALVAGVLLVATAFAARRLDVDGYTRAGIATALVLYPIQVGVGAALVVRESALAGTVHLALAMVIFAALLVPLVRNLEVLTDERQAIDAGGARAPDPAPVGADAGPESATADPVDVESATGSLPSDPVDADGAPEPADEPEPIERPDGRAARLRQTAGAYLALTKPRLMWLLCLVALAGIGLATVTGATVSLGTVVATLLGGVLAIGASGTFNHVYERDRDRKMQRTSDRPLVHQLVPVRNAVAFGAGLVAASAAVMLVWVNVLATVLTMAAIAYYVLLYTVLLKPTTSWNTVLGGGAGALPALIGWAAVTGDVGLPAIALAAVIFLWTPAHFYSLAIAYKDDYARGGFPMFPVVAGERRARRHIVGYLGATLLAASFLGWVAGLGWFYALVSVVLGVVFLRSVVRQYLEPTTERALRSFYVSNYYLGAILVAIVVETGLAAV